MGMTISTARGAERGNILFLILLAVILFAALAYAVTQSMKGGGKNASSERVSLVAAQMISQAAVIENHVNRMLLSGVTKEELEFRANPVVYSPGVAVNSNCASNKCRVFDLNGGQLTASYFPREAKDADDAAFLSPVAFKNATTGELKPWFLLASVKGIGTDAPDIVMQVGYVSQAVCEEINVQEGILARGDAELSATFTDNNVHFTYFVGDQDPWPTTLTANALGSIDNRISGRRAFCIGTGAATRGRLFFYVLLAV